MMLMLPRKFLTLLGGLVIVLDFAKAGMVSFTTFHNSKHVPRPGMVKPMNTPGINSNSNVLRPQSHSVGVPTTVQQPLEFGILQQKPPSSYSSSQSSVGNSQSHAIYTQNNPGKGEDPVMIVASSQNMINETENTHNGGYIPLEQIPAVFTSVSHSPIEDFNLLTPQNEAFSYLLQNTASQQDSDSSSINVQNGMPPMESGQDMINEPLTPITVESLTTDVYEPSPSASMNVPQSISNEIHAIALDEPLLNELPLTGTSDALLSTPHESTPSIPAGFQTVPSHSGESSPSQLNLETPTDPMNSHGFQNPTTGFIQNGNIQEENDHFDLDQYLAQTSLVLEDAVPSISQTSATVNLGNDDSVSLPLEGVEDFSLSAQSDVNSVESTSLNELASISVPSIHSTAEIQESLQIPTPILPAPETDQNEVHEPVVHVTILNTVVSHNTNAGEPVDGIQQPIQSHVSFIEQVVGPSGNLQNHAEPISPESTESLEMSHVSPQDVPGVQSGHVVSLPNLVESLSNNEIISDTTAIIEAHEANHESSEILSSGQSSEMETSEPELSEINSSSGTETSNETDNVLQLSSLPNEDVLLEYTSLAARPQNSADNNALNEDEEDRPFDVEQYLAQAALILGSSHYKRYGKDGHEKHISANEMYYSDTHKTTTQQLSGASTSSDINDLEIDTQKNDQYYVQQIPSSSVKYDSESSNQHIDSAIQYVADAEEVQAAKAFPDPMTKPEAERARPLRPSRPSQLGIAPVYSYSGGKLNTPVGDDIKLTHGSLSTATSKNGSYAFLHDAGKVLQPSMVSHLGSSAFNTYFNGSHINIPTPTSASFTLNTIKPLDQSTSTIQHAVLNTTNIVGTLSSPNKPSNVSSAYQSYYFPQDSVKSANILINNGVVRPISYPQSSHGSTLSWIPQVKAEIESSQNELDELNSGKSVLDLLSQDRKKAAAKAKGRNGKRKTTSASGKSLGKNATGPDVSSTTLASQEYDTETNIELTSSKVPEDQEYESDEGEEDASENIEFTANGEEEMPNSIQVEVALEEPAEFASKEGQKQETLQHNFKLPGEVDKKEILASNTVPEKKVTEVSDIANRDKQQELQAQHLHSKNATHTAEQSATASNLNAQPPPWNNLNGQPIAPSKSNGQSPGMEKPKGESPASNKSNAESPSLHKETQDERPSKPIKQEAEESFSTKPVPVKENTPPKSPLQKDAGTPATDPAGPSLPQPPPAPALVALPPIPEAMSVPSLGEISIPEAMSVPSLGEISIPEAMTAPSLGEISIPEPTVISTPNLPQGIPEMVVAVNIPTVPTLSDGSKSSNSKGLSASPAKPKPYKKPKPGSLNGSSQQDSKPSASQQSTGPSQQQQFTEDVEIINEVDDVYTEPEELTASEEITIEDEEVSEEEMDESVDESVDSSNEDSREQDSKGPPSNEKALPSKHGRPFPPGFSNPNPMLGNGGPPNGPPFLNGPPHFTSSNYLPDKGCTCSNNNNNPNQNYGQTYHSPNINNIAGEKPFTENNNGGGNKNPNTNIVGGKPFSDNHIAGGNPSTDSSVAGGKPSADNNFGGGKNNPNLNNIAGGKPSTDNNNGGGKNNPNLNNIAGGKPSTDSNNGGGKNNPNLNNIAGGKPSTDSNNGGGKNNPNLNNIAGGKPSTDNNSGNGKNPPSKNNTPSKNNAAPAPAPTSAPKPPAIQEQMNSQDDSMTSVRPLRPTKPKRPGKPNAGSKKPKPKPSSDKGSNKLKDVEVVDDIDQLLFHQQNITFSDSRPSSQLQSHKKPEPQTENLSTVNNSTAAAAPPKQTELLSTIRVFGWVIPVINWSYFTDLFQSFFVEKFRTSSGEFTCDESDNDMTILRSELDVDYLCGDDADFSRRDLRTLADSNICNMFCNTNGFSGGMCMPQKSCLCYMSETKNFAIKLDRLQDFNNNSTERVPSDSEDTCQNCRCLKSCQNHGKYVGYCSKSCHCGVPWYDENPVKEVPAI